MSNCSMALAGTLSRADQFITGIHNNIGKNISQQSSTFMVQGLKELGLSEEAYIFHSCFTKDEQSTHYLTLDASDDFAKISSPKIKVK